jgi:hypothetical protein
MYDVVVLVVGVTKLSCVKPEKKVFFIDFWAKKEQQEGGSEGEA